MHYIGKRQKITLRTVFTTVDPLKSICKTAYPELVALAATAYLFDTEEACLKYVE